VMSLAQASSPSGATFYLDSGGGPGSGCVDADGDGVRDDATDDADNYCETLDMRDALIALGWSEGGALVYRWSSGAPHNEAAWAARFGALLTSWFPAR
jgi:hypothetical protein